MGKESTKFWKDEDDKLEFQLTLFNKLYSNANLTVDYYNYYNSHAREGNNGWIRVPRRRGSNSYWYMLSTQDMLGIFLQRSETIQFLVNEYKKRL